MAYMDQETKAAIGIELKKIMPKGWKYSLAVNDYSTIVLNIASAPVDLAKLARDSGKYNTQFGHVQVNTHYMHEHFKGTEVHELMVKIQAVLYGQKYFDESDVMVDHHHCAYYVDVNFGRWNKPFVVA